MTEILTTANVQRRFNATMRRLYIEPMRAELARSLIPLPSQVAFHETDDPRRAEWEAYRREVIDR